MLRARLRLLDQVEASSSSITTRMTRVIQRGAKAAFIGGYRYRLDLSEFSEPLVMLMERALVRRLLLLKRDKWRSRQSLSLSFESETRRLARSLDLDIPRIRDSFFQFNLGRLERSASYYERIVNDALQEVTAAFQSTRSGILDLNRRLAASGLAARSPARVETLVRTHAQIAFNAAQYKADNDSEFVWGYTYVTVGDNRVRESHAILDGLTRPKNDPIWQTLWPPNGYNCRCQVLTLTDPEDETEVPPAWFNAVDNGFDFNPGTLL